ncbi:MAG: ABC transporter permease [Streptococcaceae bacterium]|nr:ABC transporter permease [Streptococcaceae bacterium]
MIQLIKLEKMKLNTATYLYASAGITGAAIIVTLIVLFGGRYGGDADFKEIMSFSMLSKLAMTLQIAGYSLLGTAISARVIIDEYVSKRASLLLTYPVNRKKLLTAKLIYAQGFMLFTMLVSLIVTQVVIMLFNLSIQAVVIDLTISRILVILLVYFICALLISGGMVMISTMFGFMKKSTIVSMVTNIIIIACLGNVLMNDLGIYLAAFVLLVAANIAAFTLKQRVQHLEV